MIFAVGSGNSGAGGEILLSSGTSSYATGGAVVVGTGFGSVSSSGNCSSLTTYNNARTNID